MKKGLFYMVIILCFLFFFTGCKINVTKKESQGSDVETKEPIKIVLAKEHEAQLSDPDIQLEIESVSREIKKIESEFKENAVNFVPVKGMYNHSERKMITVCLFVNKTQETICGIHGDIRLSFKELDAEIAKMTIDLDEQFLGETKPNEALLVHFTIPVRGLNEDVDFSNLDFDGVFDNATFLIVEN